MRLREGFSQFFYQALGRRVKIIPCGSRDRAYRDYKIALGSHPNDFNVLLVDSESAVSKKHTPRQHLHQQDGWQMSEITDEQCHLMVQMMEAWLIADVATLKQFYGQGFKANSIPKNRDVENIPKQRLEAALKTATKNTTKGEYHKTQHGPKILARLSVSKVRNAAPHCDRLFKTLAQELNTAT